MGCIVIPKKRGTSANTLLPANVTFFRNRALRRDLETLRKDSHPGLMVGPKSMTGSLMRERRGRLKTQSGGRLCEDRWRLEGAPSRGTARTAAVARSWKRGLEWLLPQGLGKEPTVLTP